MSLETCPSCYYTRSPKAKVCSNCGKVFESKMKGNDKNSTIANWFIQFLIFLGIVALSYTYLIDKYSPKVYRYLWMIVSYFIGLWGKRYLVYFNDKLSGKATVNIFRAIFGLILPIVLIYLTLSQVSIYQNYEATKVHSEIKYGSSVILTHQLEPSHVFDLRIEINAYPEGVNCGNISTTFSGTILILVDDITLEGNDFNSNSCTNLIGVPETGYVMQGLDKTYLINKSDRARIIKVEVDTAIASTINDRIDITSSKITIYEDPTERPFLPSQNGFGVVTHQFEAIAYSVIWVIAGGISSGIMSGFIRVKKQKGQRPLPSSDPAYDKDELGPIFKNP